MKRETWTDIQDGEFAYHAGKDETKVREHKLPFWRALIDALPDEIVFDENSRVMDLGCGGCSLLLALEQGHLVGIDPLMDQYLEKFPFLRERSDIEWIKGMAEEIDFNPPFDVIFAINSLDHVYEPREVIRHIRKSLRPGGYCAVTMNVHNTRFFRAYYSKLYRVIDHHHPYQFTPADVVDLFEGFDCILDRAIDEMWLPFAEGYYREVLKRPFVDKRKWLRAARNPFKWPMGFCKVVLDMPPHKKKPGQRSIYSDHLFVFRRDDAGS